MRQVVKTIIKNGSAGAVHKKYHNLSPKCIHTILTRVMHDVHALVTERVLDLIDPEMSWMWQHD